MVLTMRLKLLLLPFFNSKVATIDQGQIWMSIDKLWEMTGLTNQASYFVANKTYQPTELAGWEFQSPSVLLKDFNVAVQSERISFCYHLFRVIGSWFAGSF